MNNIKTAKSYLKIDTAASAPRYHWQGGLPCREVFLLRAVCADQFPWSIKSAPPAILFDTPVAGMSQLGGPGPSEARSGGVIKRRPPPGPTTRVVVHTYPVRSIVLWSPLHVLF